MKYYAKCNGVFNKSSVQMVDENGEVYYTIEHAKLPIILGLVIKDEINQRIYRVNYNPLKFKKRFQLLSEDKKQVMALSVGLKYLHKLEYNNKIFCCKGSIWKINYKLYDIDNVVATLSVVKINKERYFEINLAENKNILLALAMLVVAQSIRERLFVI